MNIKNLTDNKELLLKNPNKYVNDLITLLEDKISKKPDKVVSKVGNVTMKQHLSNLLNVLKNNPEDFVQDELDRVNSEIVLFEELEIVSDRD